MNAHTKITDLVRYVRSNYMIEFLTLSSCLLLHFLPENFKLVFALSGLLFFYFLFELKNTFLAIYLLLFVSSLFITPGKFYTFVIIPANKVWIDPFSSLGVSDGYGFVTSDFAAIGMFLYLMWWKISRSKQSFSQYAGKYSLLFTILLSLAIFFISGLYSSLFISYFPTFSVVNLFQISKIGVLLLSTFYLLQVFPKGKQILASVLSMFLVFNFILGAEQLLAGVAGLSQGTLNLNSSTQLDDQSLLTRIWGSFLHPNELALFVLIWFLMLVHIDRKRFLTWQWLLPVCGTVLLTQSRSVWIAILASLLIFQWQKILHFYMQFRQKNVLSIIKKYFIHISVGLILFVYVFLPRLQALRYTFESGSGAIRLKMIEEGVELFQDAPLFGYGIDTNVMMLYDKFPKGAITYFPFSIHMGYLQFLTEVGTIGTFFFFFPFFYCLWLLLKTRKDGSIWLLSGLLTSLGIYYIFQPHGGKLELPLLGYSLAYICYVLTQKNSKKKSSSI